MRTTVVVIGAGHAGLAMSRRLTERALDHVVLERGEVANSWRTERWDSLRLLTPNWQTALPGQSYTGDDPDGYLSAAGVAEFITGFARSIGAPVHTSTTVTAVRTVGDGYEVVTDRGTWQAAAVVLATGPASSARVPPCAAGVPASLPVHTPLTYRHPDDLPPAGVLVVGASASGVQLAEEIHRSGRPVTLAVGEHVRLPRTYRGRDVFWWLDAAGILDERLDQIDDVTRARRLPAPQLIGQPRTLGLNELSRSGVRIVGRLGRIVDGIAQCSGGLANTCALADLKLNRLLERLDKVADAQRMDVGPPERLPPTRVPPATLEIDLGRTGIGSVLFATGYQPDYSWLELPVRDHRGRLLHDGGVVRGAPGVYVIGLAVLRRRRSSYLSGAGPDTHDLAQLLHQHLDSRAGAVLR